VGDSVLAVAPLLATAEEVYVIICLNTSLLRSFCDACDISHGWFDKVDGQHVWNWQAFFLPAGPVK
jgi:S-formylglutathione hydrolase FrmB